MIGIYFSGTGNSRHALEVFLRNYDSGARNKEQQKLPFR